MSRISDFGKSTSCRLVPLLTIVFLVLAGGADGGDEAGSLDLAVIVRKAEGLGRKGIVLYWKTPPAERIAWGGLAACAVLGLLVIADRLLRVRKGRVIPRSFRMKFLARLVDGKLDRGKGVDFCEIYPSPASRVALSALKRWGRPVGDLERAASMAKQVETDLLRRNVGTLRRIAAIAPLIGLLGTLLTASRVLGAPGQPWGPAIAGALGPLTAGVGLAILALVAYDGLVGRVEALSGELDRIGAETIDAIASATPEPDPRRKRPRTDLPRGPVPPHPGRVGVDPSMIDRVIDRPRGDL